MPLVVAWLLFGALFFTLRMRFVNFRLFRHAIDLDFPFVKAYVHWMAACAYQWLNDKEATLKHAHSLLPIAKEKEIRLFESMALILSGWAEHFDDDILSLKKIDDGFTKYELSPFMTKFQLGAQQTIGVPNQGFLSKFSNQLDNPALLLAKNWFSCDKI